MSKINLETNSTDLNIKPKSSPKPQLETIGKQKSKDLHVNFNLNVTETDEKKKYLTAKFEPKELNQIKKRIQLENWILDNLKEICKSDDNQIDLDFIYNLYEIKNDELKKTFLMDKFKELKNDDKLEIDKFVDSLLNKLNL